METKICKKCELEKSLDKFGKSKRNKGGYKTHCKECVKKSDKIYTEKNKDKRKIYDKLRNKRYYEANKLAMQKRSLVYAETHKEERKQYKKNNKEKTKIIDKKYKNSHKKEIKEYKKTDKVKESNKKYRENNKEKIKISNKNYRINNPDKLKEYYHNNRTTIIVRSKNWGKSNKKIRNANAKLKREANPVYKLTGHLRTMIGSLLKNRGYRKKSKTAKILGCSFYEFKAHIETQFLPWMDWQNHGKYNKQLNFGWDLDHIIPMASAKTEEDVIRLNHYTNFQPLCSYVNRMVKRDKLDFKMV
jgi:hypothetical protein